MADCPGIFKLADMKDGPLARIRLPSGRLNSKQIRIIASCAENYAAGVIDLTNRANLQIRSVVREDISNLQNAFIKAGLSVADPAHDRVRNIAIDPLSGLVPEVLNCRPLAIELDEALSKYAGTINLSPKFSFIIDGGGPSNIAALKHDMAFKAVKNAKEEVQFRTSFAGQPIGAPLRPESLIETIITWLKNLSETIKDQPLRLKTWMDQAQRPALEDILNISKEPYPKADIWPKSLNPLRGVHPQSDAAKVAINLSLANGRLQYFQLQGLAELADKYSQGEIHLTPWQSIIMPNVLRDDIAPVWEKAEALGLLTQEAEQNLQVLSCAGSEGCVHGGFETKMTALEIREALNHMAFPSRTTVHLSACEKGCASREKSTILVMQRQTEPHIHLYANAAPCTKNAGKSVSRDKLIAELKKLL